MLNKQIQINFIFIFLFYFCISCWLLYISIQIFCFFANVSVFFFCSYFVYHLFFVHLFLQLCHQWVLDIICINIYYSAVIQIMQKTNQTMNKYKILNKKKTDNFNKNKCCTSFTKRQKFLHVRIWFLFFVSRKLWLKSFHCKFFVKHLIIM